MRELWPSEKVVFSMMNIARKNKVYRPADFFHAISPIEFGLENHQARCHVNNHLQKFVKLGLFQKVNFGQYRLMVSRKDWEAIAKKSYGLIEPEMIETEPETVSITSLEVTQAKKIEELENKLNIFAAAFCSIGRKLETNTDLHKILIETGQRVESAMMI